MPLGPTIPDLSVRSRRAELMDDPSLDRERHLHALRGLARINRISLAAARVWREAVDLGPECGGRVRILDLACGGGDVLMDVAARAARAGATMELHGCDVSPVAVEQARASRPPEAAVDFFLHDVVEDGVPEGYHLVTSSLFLHHLADADAVALLRRAAASAECAILMQDLRRTRLGYVLAWIGLHTLTRSDVARVDGLRSVRAAFTMREMSELCARAGLDRVEITPGWPQRFSVRWHRKAGR